MESRFEISTIVVFVFLLSFIYMAFAGCEKNTDSENIVSVRQELNKTVVNEPCTEPAGDRIIAYYFHGNKRCRTCVKIESQTESALKTNFSTEIGKGELEWRPVNIDEPENQHFVKDYQLYSKSVVIVDFKNGEQARWKNLPRIWELVHNEAEFEKYISQEVKEYLKGA